MQQHEQWRDIQRWPDHEVSNQGHVRRKLSNDRLPGHVLKQHSRNDGYPYVVFRIRVHSLVAEAFYGPPPIKGQVVNHKDGDRANNSVDNLEWVTYSGNAVHAYEHGLQKRGEGHGRAKLTDAQVIEIRERYHGQWGGQSALAREYGVTQGLISQIVRGEVWTHLPVGDVTSSGQRPRGEDHPSATVTEPIVKALRAEYAAGGVTHQQLAEKYNISQTTVSRIVRRRTWKHIT